MERVETVVTGRCLCGGVQYEVHGALREVWACHCSQCRQTSGNFVAASNANRADLVLTRQETLTWYRSSEIAERGFCRRCGGNLFWRRVGPGETSISIMAGTIDPPTGVAIAAHIFVADKSDFYEVTDGKPQHATW